MISLVQYIHEHLVFEGGNSVEGAGPIPGDKAKPVSDEIIFKLKEKFGKDLKCCPLGSVGKKSKDQTSGDIDIAIEMDWDNYSDVKDFVEKELNISSFGNVNDTLHVFNFGYYWGDNKIVQVDFMFVDDVDFAEFAYHSPDFTKNESKYKGMYASALFMSAVKLTDTGLDLPPEEGEAKEWHQYFFNQNKGLFLQKMTNVGKSGKTVKTPKKIDEKHIIKNIDEIIHTVLGQKATKEVCYSFESLVKYLSENFDKKKLRKIVDNFSNDWQIKLKTSNELMNELLNYMDEKFEL